MVGAQRAMLSIVIVCALLTYGDVSERRSLRSTPMARSTAAGSRETMDRALLRRYGHDIGRLAVRPPPDLSPTGNRPDAGDQGRGREPGLPLPPMGRRGLMLMVNSSPTCTWRPEGLRAVLRERGFEEQNETFPADRAFTWHYSRGPKVIRVRYYFNAQDYDDDNTCVDYVLLTFAPPTFQAGGRSDHR